MVDFTLYNVCAVPWGGSVPWEVFSTMGGYHEYRGGISWVPWGVFSTVGDILSTVGVFSTVGDIMMHVGGYLEYRGGCSVLWGYHDACGGISWVLWRVFRTVGGKVNCYLSTPRYWTPPTVLMISPHMHHDIPPRYSNFKGWYPPRYWIPSTVLMISPHGTEHPHGTQDIPPHLSWYPHSTEHPPWYSWYPPTVLMISPMVLNTPHGTENPQGTAHTLYRVDLFSWQQKTFKHWT